MREMTTAEFAKANLAALAEPVSVRRYTQTVGTYYPMGFEPAAAPPPLTLGLEGVSLIDDLALRETQVHDLETEVKRLKQELAKRPLPDGPPVAGGTTAVAGGQYVRVTRSEDPFAGLAKQDREFFERKLGKKK